MVGILTPWTKWTNLLQMKSVNVHDAKTNFSRLLAKLEKDHQPIVICRNGEPIAELVIHKRMDRTKKHPSLSKIKINYDPTETLGNKEWPENSR